MDDNDLRSHFDEIFGKIDDVRDLIKTTQTERPSPDAVRSYRSPEIKMIAASLAKAQAELEHASKDSSNPHFSQSYADLASVWNACREALTKNGISVVQLPELTTQPVSVRMTTVLLHSSGEWFESVLLLPVASPGGAQQIGSAITYARRYALSAMVGVAPNDDDDGNGAQGKQPFVPKSKQVPSPAPKPSPSAPKPTPKEAAPKAAVSIVSKPAPSVTPKSDKISKAEAAELNTLFKASNPSKPWTMAEMKTFSKDAFGVESSLELTQTQFAIFKEAFGMSFESAMLVYATEPPANA